MSGWRWRGWLVAFTLFLAGVAVGGAGMAWLGARFLRRTFQASADAPGPADRAAARIGADLTERLKLTAGESARVQLILARSAANLKGVRARAAAGARDELRAATIQIAAELPPEKRTEFFRIIARRYERLGLSAPQAEAENAK